MPDHDLRIPQRGRSEPETLFAAPAGHDMSRVAYISDCGRYRYTLGRCWDPGLPSVAFVGLNPSTADADQDDPTIRRCVRFARDWGYGSIVMLNLFAWRATDPSKLPVAPEAVGPQNDSILRGVAATTRYEAGIVVAAWGAHAMAESRQYEGLKLLDDPLYVLGLTARGLPRHPLYMKASCTPIHWEH